MSEAERLAEAERLLYAWLLKENGDEDAFNLELYEKTWQLLGLPERMQEHKAIFFRSIPETVLAPDKINKG